LVAHTGFEPVLPA